MLNNITKLEIGDPYFSVGMLQNKSGIEEWKFTNDRFDRLRNSINNIFLSKEDAQNFLKYMKEYRGNIKA